MQKLASMPSYTHGLRPSNVEPHITLKAPQEIPEDSIDEWLDIVRAASAQVKPLRIKSQRLQFITPFTLVLALESKGIRVMHARFADALGRYDYDMASHQYDEYVPHITLGRAVRILSEDERRHILEQAGSLFDRSLELGANLIRVYVRGNPELLYKSLADIALSDN